MKYCENCGKELVDGKCNNCLKQKKNGKIYRIIGYVIAIIAIIGTIGFYVFDKYLDNYYDKYFEYEKQIEKSTKKYLTLKKYNIKSISKKSYVTLDDLKKNKLIENELNDECIGYTTIDTDSKIKAYIKCKKAYETLDYNKKYANKTKIYVDTNNNLIKTAEYKETEVQEKLSQVQIKQGIIENNNLVYYGALEDGDIIEFNINDYFNLKVTNSNSGNYKLLINNKIEWAMNHGFWYWSDHLSIPFVTLGEYLIINNPGTDINSEFLFVFDTNGKQTPLNDYVNFEFKGFDDYSVNDNVLNIKVRRTYHGPSIAYNDEFYDVCGYSNGKSVSELDKNLPVEETYKFKLVNGIFDFDNPEIIVDKTLEQFLSQNICNN